tara:strand:+ start:1224 stop:2453 length:1230 start_codon:yes stop_codon:yes gene_type:complete
LKSKVKVHKYSKRPADRGVFFLKNESIDHLNTILPLPIKLWPFEGKLLFFLLGFWCILGLLILGSASWWVADKTLGDWAYFLKRQLYWYVPGLTIFSILLQTNIRDLLKISKPIFYILTLLIGATILFGSNINGSTRWLILGPISIQPSELIKPFCILEAANLFAHWNLIKNDIKIIKLTSFCILIFLIMRQPNLSTAGLIGMLFWVIALCGGVKIRSLISVAGFGGISAYISVMNNSYQMTRIQSFRNPWNDPTESGYQLIQSLLAIGSGGLFGQGFGLSMQKLQFLPFQHTDFIFAIYAEEFGLLGSMLLMVFLTAFCYLSLRIALRCRNNYTKLVATGCATLLIGQSLIHIAVTTGSIPTTGLPLPFISYGGNSLVASISIAAILLRCSLESTGLVGTLRARKTMN